MDTKAYKIALSPFSILSRIGVSMSIGLGAGFTISPFIAMVDRAIIENISGKRCQWVSLSRSVRKLYGAPLAYI